MPDFFFFFSSHTSTFHLLDKPWLQVSTLLRLLPSIFIAHRVQQSHCSSILHRVLLTRALALPASQLVHKKKSPRIYTSMHSGGFELTKMTYTRLEDNLIRHRGDRRPMIQGWWCMSHPTTRSPKNVRLKNTNFFVTIYYWAHIHQRPITAKHSLVGLGFGWVGLGWVGIFLLPTCASTAVDGSYKISTSGRAESYRTAVLHTTSPLSKRKSGLGRYPGSYVPRTAAVSRGHYRDVCSILLPPKKARSDGL